MMSANSRAFRVWKSWRSIHEVTDGVLGCHTEKLALAGLVGLGFTNAPASITPAGGHKAVVGTNPISLAVPDGQGGVALLIDQSASVVAKSEVMARARSAAELGARLKRLVAAVSDQGARVPGERRRANRERIGEEGIAVDATLLARIEGIIADGEQS